MYRKDNKDITEVYNEVMSHSSDYTSPILSHQNFSLFYSSDICLLGIYSF